MSGRGNMNSTPVHINSIPSSLNAQQKKNKPHSLLPMASNSNDQNIKTSVYPQYIPPPPPPPRPAPPPPPPSLPFHMNNMNFQLFTEMNKMGHLQPFPPQGLPKNSLYPPMMGSVLCLFIIDYYFVQFF
jgi:hypothetical protein